jgi:biotin carboxylase
VEHTVTEEVTGVDLVQTQRRSVRTNCLTRVSPPRYPRSLIFRNRTAAGIRAGEAARMRLTMYSLKSSSFSTRFVAGLRAPAASPPRK